LPDADLGSLATLGAGRTGAALAGAVVEARAIARRAGRPLAIEDLAAALAPPDRRSEAERYRTAVHEAGHAVAALVLGHAVHSVSILVQGGAGGLTVTSGGASLPTRADLEARVVVGLAGRAAEEVLCGEVSAGASGDLAEATARLTEVHCSLGLGTRLRVSPDPRATLTLDRELAAAVEGDLVRLHARAVEIVRGARPGLDRVVDALMARRVLSGVETKDFLTVGHSSVSRDKPQAQS
jgi:ATP-dependent Zn protease